ncbi:MAG: hypothetical protein IKG09_01770 [Mycoplasmataceae bacterium]|nr:hypothetical protein [Mycoplasmataceae bacterium]
MKLFDKLGLAFWTSFIQFTIISLSEINLKPLFLIIFSIESFLSTNKGINCFNCFPDISPFSKIVKHCFKSSGLMFIWSRLLFNLFSKGIISEKKILIVSYKSLYLTFSINSK